MLFFSTAQSILMSSEAEELENEAHLLEIENTRLLDLYTELSIQLARAREEYDGCRLISLDVDTIVRGYVT